ncbi:MAG: AAA-ATPase [Candidatus Magnetoglobus multicellularis str. Araruama]|uniref:AAA-ATPase n=1 Tax=Candidatus Magnetoglobus multicellularis str. Araruama TaxID=890399 RepID=A0A1V1P865_9BACT|nr:MAG: AAA-ATPase [Candidatus Magnetoglobus multicellularis str. Araruama]
MNRKSKKRILYGNASYKEIIHKNGYFVDKTHYIEKLERIEDPVFLRPRRFGKSLWCNILECYYDINQKDDFDNLFGHTYIGQNPTRMKNSYFVLHLDFSVIQPNRSVAVIEKNFDHVCNLCMNAILELYKQWFQEKISIDMNKSAALNLYTILSFIRTYRLPLLYVIIDEYDNFANQLVLSNKTQLYDELTGDDSFLKPFFKTLKKGRKDGSIANVYITGVLPITLDDLASGFNIADFLTLHPKFECMLGFTQAEVDKLLDEIYHDYDIDQSTRKEVESVIKTHYNGYHFVKPEGEALYNSTILMFFLKWFIENNEIPENLTDLNLRTDLSWVKRITGKNPEKTKEVIQTLNIGNLLPYDKNILISKFNMSQFFDKSFFPISFFYLGMLTRHDDFSLKLPNLNMQKIFAEYFNEIQNIDVSTLYQDMMQRFINHPDLPRLFADYWQLYISQLPEAIFSKVNENFYRTTFFELCSRHISKWFTWNMERSYPKGRTDLEFVGKYNEKYADLRIVIEFKYFSNAKFKAFKCKIDDFHRQVDDALQLKKYVDDIKKEWPKATIESWLIYCFGNQGFRIFSGDKGKSGVRSS